MTTFVGILFYTYMNTLREMVYMVIDQLKNLSDDSYYTEEHIIYLLNKYRALLLKQRYSDVKRQVPESNYQTICIDLERSDITGIPCGNNYYLRSTSTIPTLMKVGNTTVYPMDFYQGNIIYTTRDRMRYVGYNKYLQNIIYCSLGADNKLYFKSDNPQHKYLDKVRMTGVFEDVEDAFNMQCPDECGDTVCDILDKEFPLESALVVPVIQAVIKDLLGAKYQFSDDINDAADDSPKMSDYINRRRRQNNNSNNNNNTNEDSQGN